MLCLPRRFAVFVAYSIAIFFKNFIHERYFESFHDVFERSVYTCVVPKNGDKCQRVIGSVINHRVVLDAFFDKSVVDSRLRFGFSSIGIDVGHTHGHAQTNGIGELFPCFYIAADFVVLSQNLINGILMFFGSRGKLFQYFPRIFEIDEQGVVNLIHRFVSNGRFLHVGKGPYTSESSNAEKQYMMLHMAPISRRLRSAAERITGKAACATLKKLALGPSQYCAKYR